MPIIRKSAKIAAAAAVLAALVAPSLAQQPYPPRPGAPLDHVCFTADQGGGYFRIEWPASQRWAIFRWQAGSTLRIFLYGEQAQWCWGAKFSDMTRPCRPQNTQPATPSC